MDPSRPIPRSFSVSVDPLYSNRAEVRLENQNDTLGNLIKCKLEENPNVKQAAYRMTHRSDTFVLIQFTTNEKTNPKEAFEQAIQELVAETKFWRRMFSSL